MTDYQGEDPTPEEIAELGPFDKSIRVWERDKETLKTRIRTHDRIEGVFNLLAAANRFVFAHDDKLEQFHRVMAFIDSAGGDSTYNRSMFIRFAAPHFSEAGKEALNAVIDDYDNRLYGPVKK